MSARCGLQRADTPVGPSDLDPERSLTHRRGLQHWLRVAARSGGDRTKWDLAYGCPRITAELRGKGERVNLNMLHW
ncbi:hypothetical protein GCM10023169_13980 [Georgenia halophila]|uniref:Uncharacterized protein n=1 Tax=Georgenia halophila TaxID=620889 RepID=A0ABP8L401_9MICO